MTSRDEYGVGLARKSTRRVTNMAHAAVILHKRCAKDHRHVRPVHGRAAGAQEYPEDAGQVFLDCLDLEIKSNSILGFIGDELHEQEQVQEEWRFDENDGTELDREKTRKRDRQGAREAQGQGGVQTRRHDRGDERPGGEVHQDEMGEDEQS